MDITPDKQNIDSVFANTTYYIDFYQRDYRWNDEPVLRLLDDVFFKFSETYARKKELDPGPEVIRSHYPWYYLNTYVTNVVDGRVYIVDGQQRLTTLSLILTKLFHLAKMHGSELTGWIEGKIGGQSGYQRQFWMNHVNHQKVQQSLFEGDDLKSIDVSSGITAQNMVSNYQTISSYIDKRLKDKKVLETFIFYFLHRLVLINLTVERTDVPMVFEVINDRGVRLRPYEILKGKLLGQIDKVELDKEDFNGLWEQCTSSINAFKEDEVDSFFRFYLKAKYAKSRKEGTAFDGDYHRVMFSRGMEEQLKLSHNPSGVKQFLKGEFSYFSKLYVKVLKANNDANTEFRHVYFNGLLDLDAPFLLILSACALNDPQEDIKIRAVSEEIDRYFSLLQVQNAYDSNEFADSLYDISELIRDKPPEEYRAVFDSQLSQRIAARRNVDEAEPLSYAAFRQTGINLNLRFKRFFFARIDQFLAESMNLNPKHPIADLVTKTGYKTGFHVEHILSWNDENRALFDNDEERFEQERNRLGGLIPVIDAASTTFTDSPSIEPPKSRQCSRPSAGFASKRLTVVRRPFDRSTARGLRSMSPS